MRWAAVAAAMVVAGCGAARAVTSPVRSTEGEHEVASIGEAALTIVARESEGRTWMSLWIDAGARDAEPAAVATVAAWAATQGTAVQATVLPDGTEMRASCESERVEVCVDALAGALATRRIEDRALGEALVRLRAARRGGRGDAVRSADRMAIAALIGEDRGLDPLGAAADDMSIDRAAVERFVGAHWGPSRALFVAVGDVEEGRLRDAIASALSRAPRATAGRAAREIAPRVGARVEIGDDDVASVALAVGSAREGVAIGRRAVAEIDGGSASVFALRGADVVVVRGRDPERVAGAVAYARGVAREVGEAAGEDALAEDDPLALARRVGARWVARSEARADGGFGVGAVVAGGRGDGDAGDPDSAARRAAGERAAAIAERAAGAAALAGVEGDASEQSATLRLAEGPRVLARREQSGRVAIALSVDGGPSGESARAQGRSAMLARLLARCASHDGTGGWADARSIGVVIEVAPAGAFDAVERVTRCVRQLPTGPAVLEEIRARAIAELSADDVRLARAASAIAPGAPGAIAPRGQASTLAAIEPRSLRRTWREMATRARTTIAIVGEVSAERAARVAMLGLARLPAGEARAAATALVEIGREEIVAVSASDDRVEALVALRDPRPRAHAAAPGARAVLDAMVSAIDGPSLHVVWARAGAGPEGAWVAIAVRASEEALVTAGARIDAARARAEAALEGALEGALEAAREARARQAATAMDRARRLATERTGDAPDATESADAARALLRAPVRWVIARPSPDARR